jgi:hypothetical protein
VSEAVTEAHWELKYTVDMTATRHVVEASAHAPRAPLIFIYTPLRWVLVSLDELLMVPSAVRRPPGARAALRPRRVCPGTQSASSHDAMAGQGG